MKHIEADGANANGGRGMSRRTFMAAAAFAGVQVAVFGLAGCAPKNAAAQAGGYTPGTYTGSADGKFDRITVETEFSDSAIVDIRIIEQRDTARIADAALDAMPARIIAAQGLGVDTVTGATLTSMGIVNAVANCVDEAGGNASKLKKIGASEPTGATETLEADVVVVGGGASGMGVAIAAAQAGKRVIVLEKNSNIGGNCLVSGGYLEYLTAPESARPDMTPELHRYVEEVLNSDVAASTDPAYVEQVRAQYDAYKASGSTKLFDSQEFYALDFAATTGEGLPVDAYLPGAANISALNDWMTELGFDWQTPTHLITGYAYPRWSNPTSGVCGEGYFDFFDGVLAEGGYDVQVLLATTAQEITMDGSTVSGVVAVAEDGTTYNVSAPTVVLASGGFSGNGDLLREYNTMWPYPEGTLTTTNVNGHTGDGIVMARKLGAAVGDMGNQMMFPFNDPITFSAENVSGTFADSPIVNKQGKRFLDETADRFEMTAALMEQEDSLCFMVSDADSVYVTEASPGEDTLLRRGQLFKADTLEDLAKQMGVDSHAFVTEIERFNAFAQAGQDEDFGRYLFTDISVVDTPPFYAAPATWAAHITIGGLEADNDTFAVLDESGQPIAGLYACGEVRNGICGVSSIADGVAAGKAIFAA